MVVLAYQVSRTPRQGGDSRGSAQARRARKGYLLTLWGDGDTCPCSYCNIELTSATLEADRIIPGTLGGSYTRTNVIPACRQCNASRGDATIWSFAPRLARKLKRMGFVVSAKSVPAGAIN
jgi:5-methylcytosine-specific restriction endonuclease McrA